MSQIITKNFHGSNIRIILIEEKEWFIAKDIAKLLGYVNTSESVQDHCKNITSLKEVLTDSISRPIDKSTAESYRKLLGNSWSQTKLIPESDVWRLIIKSQLPNAEKIEKWIMEDILPSIRKTGSYSLLNSQSPELLKLEERIKLLELSNKALLVFKSAFYNIGITRPEELAITSNLAVKKETEVDFIELAGKKGISTTETFFTVTELCKYIRKSSNFSESQKLSVSTKNNDKPRAENLNNLLRNADFQARDENGIYRATEKGKKFSDFVQNKSKYSSKTVVHTVWKMEILKEVF